MYVCNPLNVDYRYQFYSPQVEGMEQRADKQTAREAADPTMLCFQGKYYIFASMTLSVWIFHHKTAYSQTAKWDICIFLK